MLMRDKKNYVGLLHFPVPPILYTPGYTTNATLVVYAFCRISSAVIVCMCPETDISAQTPPIGVKFCTMVHVSRMCLLPFGGGAPRRSPNPKSRPKFLPFDREYLEYLIGALHVN